MQRQLLLVLGNLPFWSCRAYCGNSLVNRIQRQHVLEGVIGFGVLLLGETVIHKLAEERSVVVGVHKGGIGNVDYLRESLKQLDFWCELLFDLK